MRNKFFLFIIAAFMATSSAWADSFGIGHYEQIDSIPAPKYMQNITYDKQTGELSFDDTFSSSINIDREYVIYAYSRTNNTHLYKLT